MLGSKKEKNDEVHHLISQTLKFPISLNLKLCSMNCGPGLAGSGILTPHPEQTIQVVEVGTQRHRLMGRQPGCGNAVRVLGPGVCMCVCMCVCTPALPFSCFSSGLGA